MIYYPARWYLEGNGDKKKEPARRDNQVGLELRDHIFLAVLDRDRRVGAVQ
jgi:hypothetical protein